MAQAQGLTLSTTSNLNSTQQTLIANAKMAFEPSAPDPSLVMTEQLPPGHFQATVATYARLADASQLTEGQDLAQIQQLRTNTTTVNPSEHGILVTLTTRAVRRQMDANLVSTVGTKNGISIRAREAKDVQAIYDSFTKSTPGATNPVDITHVRGAMAYLMTDNDDDFGPAPLPIEAVAHAEQISDFVQDLTDTDNRAEGFSTGLSQELVQRWWRGSDRVYGVGIFHGGYLTRDSGDDVKGALKHRESIYLVQEGDADPTDETDNSQRVTEYGLFMSWGEALRVDVHGVELFSDAAATI